MGCPGVIALGIDSGGGGDPAKEENELGGEYKWPKPKNDDIGLW